VKRILIVEDHPDTQSLLCDLLELEGYEVRCSGEAQGVLQLARRIKPHLIILDVMLPGISGLELLQMLDADNQMRSVPVLMCSGALEQLEANKDRIRQSGAHVVTKPFTLDQLLSSVEKAMAPGRRDMATSA
jgi:DNA-binding response OmpR family regulator